MPYQLSPVLVNVLCVELATRSYVVCILLFLTALIQT